MATLQEGDLILRLPEGVQGRKFDDQNHGLSHCMKAVDFIVESNDYVIFIEFKDPDHPRAREKDRKRFFNSLLAGNEDDEFVRKYRDTFIYRWAENVNDKPIKYYILIGANRLDAGLLTPIIDNLARKLPVSGPTTWQRQIVTECAVFNLETWNKFLPDYPVVRESGCQSKG
jgi:hypothetical protein